MAKYDFEIRLDGVVVKALKAQPIADVSEIWPKVIEFARDVDEPGSIIHVQNELGELVVLTGFEALKLLTR